MSDMRPPPPNGDGSWIPVPEAVDRGMLVRLVEDRLWDRMDDGYLRRTLDEHATDVALIEHRDREQLPGIVLDDGRVLVLSWEQAMVIRKALAELLRVKVPALHDQYGAPRAIVELPKL